MIVCPRCERPVSEHERPCVNRQTRRFFFGLMAGAATISLTPEDFSHGNVVLATCSDAYKAITDTYTATALYRRWPGGMGFHQTFPEPPWLTSFRKA